MRPKDLERLPRRPAPAIASCSGLGEFDDCRVHAGLEHIVRRLEPTIFAFMLKIRPVAASFHYDFATLRIDTDVNGVNGCRVNGSEFV